MSAIISRAEAKAAGLKRYFTGKPCPKGHVADRGVGDGACVICKAEDSRRRYEANPDAAREAARERARRSREANPEAHREAKRQSSRRWREANPEAHREISRRWREANRESHREAMREHGRRWYKANRESYRANNRKRAARVKEGATGAEVQRWVRTEPKECLWCGADCANEYHIDHVTPLSRGGSHEIWNLAIACRDCNLRKSAAPPALWLFRLFSGQVALPSLGTGRAAPAP